LLDYVVRAIRREIVVDLGVALKLEIAWIKSEHAIYIFTVDDAEEILL
jgi:hypothetical protein